LLKDYLRSPGARLVVIDGHGGGNLLEAFPGILLQSAPECLQSLLGGASHRQDVFTDRLGRHHRCDPGPGSQKASEPGGLGGVGRPIQADDHGLVTVLGRSPHNQNRPVGLSSQPIDCYPQCQPTLGVFAGRSGDDQPGTGATGGVDQLDEGAAPSDLDLAIGSDFGEESANVLLDLSVGSALEHHAGDD
jgi:hypothetical protein